MGWGSRSGSRRREVLESGGGGRRGGGGGGGGGGGTASTPTTPSGCMSTVLQFLDFHHYFNFTLHHQQQQHPQLLPQKLHQKQLSAFNSNCSFTNATIIQGVEAPRNSLESEERSMGADKEENLNIPMGVEIERSTEFSSKLRIPKPRIDDFSSDSSFSPGPKTPNLVARLMGLDILPQNSSPISSSSSSHARSHSVSKSHNPRHDHRSISGTRSLPETPRISLARRSDVEHRHSLQINKENISIGEALEARSRKQCMRNECDENRSPSHLARQIVKQLKENAGRKVGNDITNTMRNREVRRDELMMQIKSKKNSYNGDCDGEGIRQEDPSKISKLSTGTCSPRLKFLENKKEPILVPKITMKNLDNFSQFGKVSKPNRKSSIQMREGKAPQRCDLIRNKQEEPFIHSLSMNRAKIPVKKCKKTLLSSDLLNINVPCLVSSTTRLTPKQSHACHALLPKPQLPNSPSQSYEIHKDAAAAPTAGDAESQYVSQILNRTVLYTLKQAQAQTPVSFPRCFFLDPSIFNDLEHSFSVAGENQFRYRSNRKLFFDLVDEMLPVILKPNSRIPEGSELGDLVCDRIKKLPRANCEVLQDIDALVGMDMPEPKLRSPAVISGEERNEVEAIVTEIESAVFKVLVEETAAIWRRVEFTQVMKCRRVTQIFQNACFNYV